MDGLTSFKTVAAEALPAATEVMDPFHVGRVGRPVQVRDLEAGPWERPGEDAR